MELARKAFEDFDALWDDAKEESLLAELIEPMYSRMHRTVHAMVAQTFPAMEDFRLDDQATRQLLQHAARQVVRINATTRNAIREQLVIGQERGYSAWEIAHGVPKEGYHGIDGLYFDKWKGRTDTIARNELMEAQWQASLERYTATGMVDHVRLRDGTSSAPDVPCLARNDTVVPLSSRPQRLHVNCLPGDQIVLAPHNLGATARWFQGEVIVIQTARDDHLTCTPNHPVLTPRGWIAAQHLREGDDVLRCVDSQRLAGIIDPHAHHRPARIQDVARALLPGRATTTVPLTAEDFHGDAVDGDICVVGANRLLGHDRRVEHADQIPFSGTLLRARALIAQRSLIRSRIAVGLASDGSMRSGGQVRAVLGGRVGVAQQRGGAAVTSPRPPAPCPSGHHVAAVDALFAGDGIRRLTSTIPLIEPVKIRRLCRLQYSGHVYNLETAQGWYIAGNIITHNCTLVVIPILKGPAPPSFDRLVDQSVGDTLFFRRGKRPMWIGVPDASGQFTHLRFLPAEPPTRRPRHDPTLGAPEWWRRNSEVGHRMIDAMAAEALGLDLATYQRQADDNARRIVESALRQGGTFVRLFPDTLEAVVHDGRFKNQFESNISMGAFDPDWRREVERDLFGYPLTTAGRRRPIYGYISGHADGSVPDDTVSQYGNIRVKLRASTYQRTTLTFEDSLNEYGNFDVAPVPLLQPTRLATKTPYIFSQEDAERLREQIRTVATSATPLTTDISRAANIDKLQNDLGVLYNEVQIHGGVTLDDIEEVIFPSRSGTQQSPWTIQQLIRRGIKITYLDEEAP